MNGNLSKWNSVASFGTGLGALRADKAGSAPFAGGRTAVWQTEENSAQTKMFI